MNRYKEMKERQQKEINALPLGFAFSDEQFNKTMREWGLDPEKDTDKIYSIGYGGFIQKKDCKLFHETLTRSDMELKTAIKEDTTGDGFIFDMFLYELENHEYGYTMEIEDTLDALGLTWKEVLENSNLKHGFNKARKEILRKEEG